jgi:hypothetical protein
MCRAPASTPRSRHRLLPRDPRDRAADDPALLDKIGEAMAKEFDFAEEVRGLQVPTLIVAADALLLVLLGGVTQARQRLAKCDLWVEHMFAPLGSRLGLGAANPSEEVWPKGVDAEQGEGDRGRGRAKPPAPPRPGNHGVAASGQARARRRAPDQPSTCNGDQGWVSGRLRQVSAGPCRAVARADPGESTALVQPSCSGTRELSRGEGDRRDLGIQVSHPRASSSALRARARRSRRRRGAYPQPGRWARNEPRPP